MSSLLENIEIYNDDFEYDYIDNNELLDLSEIINCNIGFNKYVKENNIQFCKNVKENYKIIESYLNKKGKNYSKKFNKTLKKMYNNKIPKQINILILGVTGRGKSTLLNNLFDTNFIEKNIGRGTEEKTISKVDFGGLTINIIDTVGLGDIQVNKEEIDFSYNNEILLEYLKKEDICCIFQVFDFSRNRDLNEDKVQIENFLKNIDFNSSNYIDIINCYNIIFTKANKYVDDDSYDDLDDVEYITMKEKKENIDVLLTDFNDYNDSEKEEKINIVNKLINSINKSYQERYEYNVNSIKNIVRNYLDKNIKCTNKSIIIENIINNIKFSYAGNIDKKTKKINHIPLFSKNFYKNFENKIKVYKPDYTYKIWNINWRHQIFENLILSCGSKNAVAIEQAINKKENINLQNNIDSTGILIENNNVHNFYITSEKTENVINKGKKTIWKEALGSALGGGASAGAYVLGLITGGPAIIFGGFLALVGWKTGSYFSNDKEKSD